MATYDVAHRSAIVTGAGSGIGRAVALELAANGASVIVADLVEAPLTTLLEEIRAAGGTAGIGGEQSFIGDYSLDGWRRVIEVNLNAVFYGLKAQLPSMAENGGGSIVNMASILGSVGFATSSAYVTANHGLLGLTQNAALEYGAKKVRTNAVGPGFIHTPLVDSALDASTQDFLAAKHALGRLGTPQEVSALVCFLALGCRVLRLRQLPPRRWRVRGAVAVVVGRERDKPAPVPSTPG